MELVDMPSLDLGAFWLESSNLSVPTKFVRVCKRLKLMVCKTIPSGFVSSNLTPRTSIAVLKFCHGSAIGRGTRFKPLLVRVRIPLVAPSLEASGEVVANRS